MIMNKTWEVIEHEARKGYEEYPRYRRGSMRPSYRKESDKDGDAYEDGFEDGYSEAMRKIFHIIKDSDK